MIDWGNVIQYRSEDGKLRTFDGCVWDFEKSPEESEHDDKKTAGNKQMHTNTKTVKDFFTVITPFSVIILLYLQNSFMSIYSFVTYTSKTLL